MPGWMFVIAIAHAGSTMTVRTCADEAEAGTAWVIARTVLIESSKGSGTGVLVSPDGFALTAAHVVDGVDTVQLSTKDGDPVSADVVRRVPEADLAIVRASGDSWPCLPLKLDQAEPGSDLVVVGSPFGDALSYSVTKGVVSAYRDVGGVTLIQTDASLNAGNSGGPMVGAQNDLIGVVSFKLVAEGMEGLGFGIASVDLPAVLSLRFGEQSDETSVAKAPPPPPPPKTGAIPNYGKERPPESGFYSLADGVLTHQEGRPSDEKSACEGITVRPANDENGTIVGYSDVQVHLDDSGIRVHASIGAYPMLSTSKGFEVVWRTAAGNWVRLVTDESRGAINAKIKVRGSKHKAYWDQEFPVDEEVLRLLADSPLAKETWSLGMKSMAIDVDEKDGLLIQQHFACALEQMVD